MIRLESFMDSFPSFCFQFWYCLFRLGLLLGAHPGFFVSLYPSSLYVMYLPKKKLVKLEINI